MPTRCVMVASDTAPVRELLEPGIKGQLVPFHDPAAIADQIIFTLADRSGRCVLLIYLPRQMRLVE